MKRYSMELGCKNVSIVMPDADIELAVEGIAWGAFATSGQRCTATSRVVSLHPEFADALIEKVKTFKVGPGSDETVDLAPLINRAQRDRVMEYIRVGVEDDKAHAARSAVNVLDDRPARQGQLHRADGVHRRDAEHAHRAGGDLRPRHRGDPGRLARRGDRRRELDAVRPVGVDLHGRRRRRDARRHRARVRHRLRERADHRRRGAAALRRHEEHRQRLPRSRPPRLDEFSETKAVSIDFSHRLQKAQFKPGE